MKKTLIYTACALIMALTACNEVPSPATGEGSLSLSVAQGDVPTKASSTDSLEYEVKVNILDIFVFQGNASGAPLYFHERITNGGTPSDPTRFDWSFDNIHGTVSLVVKKLPASTYTAVLVANMPEAISSLTSMAAIKDAAVTLANHSTTASSGFPMFAEKAGISVEGGVNSPSPTAISLSRFASRVRLVSIENTIPASVGYSDNSAISVKGVFVTNVASAWKLGGAEVMAVPGTPTSIVGKKGGDNISAGNLPEYAVTGYFPSAVSVARGASQNLGWSCYALPTQAVLSGATAPKLVILATVNGTDYYYPILLLDATASPARGGLARNTTYDVRVSISGTGSLDPDVVVQRGALATDISVAAWVSGADYTEII